MDDYKFTKGKWVLEKNPHSMSFHLSITEGWHRKWIASIHTGHVGIGTEEGEANALLISKAPELLEMLRDQLIFLKRMMKKVRPSNSPIYDEAIAVCQEIEQLIKQATEI